MSFFRIFAGKSGELDPAVKKSILRVKRVAFALIVAALFAGCAGCSQCKSCTSGGQDTAVVRTPADVSDFTVVFIRGEAMLYWVDSTDSFLDHIEITWDPDGETPVHVAKGVEKFALPGLETGKEYKFTVKAVDQWGNKSEGVTGGTGRAIKEHRSPTAPPNVIMGIKGTPAAGQATLSWTNLDGPEYDHIEITYDPGFETLIRVPKGVSSKTITHLANGLEHTFYVAAVDAEGNRIPLDDVGLFIPDHPTSAESIVGRAKDGQVTLVWTDPNDPELSHMEVVYSPGGEFPVYVPKGVQTYTYTGLSDDIEYEFTVYAVDNDDQRRPVIGVFMVESAPSPPAPVVEPEPEVSYIRGRPIGGQMSLNWNDPALAGLDHIEIVINPPVGTG
ncbi:MAG: fibronectin type III domain-containing protein, partial [Treponema sp.]|nr:fibronectin type III domain-containing protein [Treponema sp.]